MSTKEYGPVNCNVAIAMSERQPISTEPCERCGSTTPSKGCLFYDWYAPGDWHTKPQFQRDSEKQALAPRVPEDITKLSPEDFAARIAEAQGDSVGTKLTRVQRAMIMDIISEHTDATDEELSRMVDDIVHVLNYH